MLGNAIVDAVKTVTKRWIKQRKAEERDAQACLRRSRALRRSRKVTRKDAAWEVMEAAYMKASNTNTLPAHVRQIMYAARGPIQELTGEALDDQYFTQTLLPDYMREFAEETANWDVVFDARGHFHEPHTCMIVPSGTLSVREYLGDVDTGQDISEPVDITSGGLFPTRGPENRYQAIMFIEKEGFLPLFKRVQLAERYDIAIMSTKPHTDASWRTRLSASNCSTSSQQRRRTHIQPTCQAIYDSESPIGWRSNLRNRGT